MGIRWMLTTTACVRAMNARARALGMTDRGTNLLAYQFQWPAADATLSLGVLRGVLLLCIAGTAAWLFGLALRRLGGQATADPTTAVATPAPTPRGMRSPATDS